MIRYYVCNLENRQDFSVENVTFQRVEDYAKRTQILKDDHRDQLTFYATVADRKLSQLSMLFPEGVNLTSVDDMMILLSLAQSRNIYYPKAEDIGDTGTTMWGMPLGGNRKVWGVELIMEHEIENYLITSLSQIRKSQWLDKTGFNPAVFWWFESIYEGRPLETKFVSSFIALEILANSYTRSNKLKNSGVRSRIEGLANSYNWDFMDSALIKDWNDIRRYFVHKGSTKRLQGIHKSLRATRYFQLIHSVQIALIDLLGFNNFARRQYIISEIKKPLRKTYKVGGPFPLPA